MLGICEAKGVKKYTEDQKPIYHLTPASKICGDFRSHSSIAKRRFGRRVNAVGMMLTGSAVTEFLDWILRHGLVVQVAPMNEASTFLSGAMISGLHLNDFKSLHYSHRPWRRATHRDRYGLVLSRGSYRLQLNEAKTHDRDLSVLSFLCGLRSKDTWERMFQRIGYSIDQFGFVRPIGSNSSPESPTTNQPTKRDKV